MRDPEKSQESRRPLVEELSKLGIPKNYIASLLGLSYNTIREDIRRLNKAPSKEHSAFPGQPTAFARALVRYAQLRAPVKRPSFELPIFQSSPLRTLSPDEIRLRDILAGWLKVNEVLAFLEGVDETVCRLMVPELQVGQEKYLRLLSKVFSSGYGNTRGYHFFWVDYLEKIAEQKVAPATSSKSLCQTLMNGFVSAYRSRIMPIWPDNAVSMVKEELTKLNSRQRRIVRLRHLLIKPRKYRVIAKTFGVSMERVRQIEYNGLRKLSRIARLKSLVEPAGSLSP